MKKIKKILNFENCPICMSSNIKINRYINIYGLYKCQNCSLLFTQQQKYLTREEINKEIYNQNYLESYEQRNSKLINRFRKRVSEIEKYKKGGTILDFGCSSGIFLEAINKYSKYKWYCTGIDINKRSINIAKKNNIKASFILGTISNQKWKKNKFDVITCFDVLEHDIDLNETIRSLLRILKPGGVLVVQSPNYRSLMTYLCGENWDWWSVPDHVFHFSYTYLTKYLQKNNFTIISANTWEPRVDFVRNIQGTIKGKKSTILSKILSKLLIPYLNILWFISTASNSLLKNGGLILIYAQK